MTKKTAAAKPATPAAKAPAAVKTLTPVKKTPAAKMPPAADIKAAGAAAKKVTDALAPEAPTPVLKARVSLADAAKEAGFKEPLTTVFIDPKLIDREPGWNNRFDMGDIEGLARSIKTKKAADGHGLIQDLIVTPKDGGRFLLVDGDRRMTGLEMLLAKGEEFAFGVPCKVAPKGTTRQELRLMMFNANTAKPLLPIEEAVWFKEMRDGDKANGVKPMTIKQIEAATGRSDNSIVGALALLDADDSLQEAVKSGKIGATLGKSIAVNARGDKAKQAELVDQALKAGKNKTAKAAVARAVDDQRRQKAAKKGLKLKMRALSDSELSDLGASVAESLVAKLAEADMDVDADIRKLIKSDVKYAMAATFGALEALKAAAGVEVNLDY